MPWAEWTEPERQRFCELLEQASHLESIWTWGPGPREQVDAGAPRPEFNAAGTRARAERRQAIKAARLYTVIGGERVGILPPKDCPLLVELAKATALPADAAKRSGKPTGRPKKLAEREKVRKLHRAKPGLSNARLAEECGVSRTIVADALHPKTD